MSNIYFLIFASLLCCVQCLPVESSSNSASSDSLHLYVNNSTKSTNYHLTSVMTELEDVDEEIARELDFIVPYMTFLFDTLLGRAGEGDGCINDMVIQLVPDDEPSKVDQATAAQPPVEPPVAAKD